MQSTTYQPESIEAPCYATWEEKGLFNPDYHSPARPDAPRNQSFCIAMPPPNVTGTLHMGHALDNTIQDILIRWHRMLGHRTLWMPGTDHAGIATQNVVERKLREEGVLKEDLGRAKFLEKTWEWANARKGDILGQFKRLGISPDWSRERFTFDEGLCHAVRVAFVRLYDMGLIYKGTYIVNWCPRCKSAISDIETDYVDEESHLWEIQYPLADGSGSLVVATTRPETMYGDVAVAVNPEDPRYATYIGKTVKLPITGREIPIIGDEYVDTAFGTGVLKITPAHDPNDFEIGRKHNLEAIWVLDEAGAMKDVPEVPALLHGIERFDARKQTESLLAEEGSLVRKLEHNHRVGHCQRCGTVIEPLLSKQWFVKTKPLAEKSLRSLDKGEIRFIPERWTKDYVRWMVDIQDWCISRQLWWGHQIPAWLCAVCNQHTVAVDDPTSCAHCGSNQIEQESDVLDTWFSSGLWPFSTLGWPNEQSEDLKNFYPTQVLVTGFDIIFFWVARMVMMGHALTEKSPFNTVYVHGLIRDEKGQKMSKSKGNTVDPVEVIESIGCDGFRFALASLITYGGQDIKLAPDKLELGKVFGNKIWNASRFVMMNLDGVDDQPIQPELLSVMDQWILARYFQVTELANQNLNEYKFGELAGVLYEFTWNSFCDWYVEFAKSQLKDETRSANTKRILLFVLDGILRLLHPVMPYITEEIWLKFPHRRFESIMVSPYPQSSDVQHLVSNRSTESIDFVLDVVRSIRNIRQQFNVPHPTAINVTLESPEKDERHAIEAGMPILRHFIKLEAVDVHEALSGKPTHAAANVVGHTRILVPLEGLIDVELETKRLQKKSDSLTKEQDQLYRLMSNQEFLEKAPPEVITKNKDRLAEINKQLKLLKEQLVSLL